MEGASEGAGDRVSFIANAASQLRDELLHSHAGLLQDPVQRTDRQL